MKQFLFFFAFTISTVLAHGQDIADVSLAANKRLKVWNSKNVEIAGKYLFDGDTYAGFSTTIVVVVAKDRRVKVYDQKLNEIANKYLYTGDSIKAVNGSYIIVKNTNGKVTIYDSKFHELSHRYE